MAKACLGKSIEDEIQVQTPKGNKIWHIENIYYETNY